MSDDHATPETPDERPLTRAERLFMRISVWQTVLSVAGVFTGAVALYAALNESDAVRRQSAAEVWPFLQTQISDYDNESGAHFGLSITNAGVGPARMRSMRVTLNGEAVRDWDDGQRRLTGANAVQTNQSFIVGRVLSPGERVDMMSTTDRALVRLLREAVASPQTSIEYCYCSIFDTCWFADIGANSPNLADPEPVKACPDFGDEAFLK